MGFGSDIGLLFRISAKNEAKGAVESVVHDFTNLGKKGEEIFANLGKNIGLSGKAAEDLAKSVGIAGIALAGLGVAAFEVGERLLKLAENAAEFGEKIFLASEKTGLSTETMSALKVVAEQTGSSLEQVTSAVGRFALVMGAAQQGNEKAIAKLKDLHVTSTNLDTAFAQVVKRIYEIEDPVKKATAAGEAFGNKFGREIIPIISQFKGDLPGLIKYLGDMGLTMSEKDAKAAHEFDAQMKLVNTQLDMAKVIIGEQLLPTFNKFAKTFSDWLAKNKDEVKSWGTEIANAINKVVIGFKAEILDMQGLAAIINFITTSDKSTPEAWRIMNAEFERIRSQENELEASRHQGNIDDFVRNQKPGTKGDFILGHGGAPATRGSAGDSGDAGTGTGGSTTDNTPDFASDREAAKFNVALRKLDPALKAQILKYAAQYNIPSALALAQIFSESTFQTGVVSPQGATGLTQGMPATTGQARFGGFTPDEMKNPKNALTFWGKYMTFLFDRYGDWDLAVLAYHQGEGTVDKLVKAMDAGKSGKGIIGPKGQAYLKKIDSLAGLSDSTRYGDPDDKAQTNKYAHWGQMVEKFGNQEMDQINRTTEAYEDQEQRKKDAADKAQDAEDKAQEKRDKDHEDWMNALEAEIKKEGEKRDLLKEQLETIYDQIAASVEAPSDHPEPGSVVAGALGSGIKGSLGVQLPSIFGDTGQIKSQAEVLKSIYADVASTAGGAIGSMVDGLANLATQWLTTGKFSAKAALQMATGVLIGLAIQSGVKAIFETAEGFAALAVTFGVPNPSSIAHFAAAGIYATVAGVAGGIGIATGLASRSFKDSTTAAAGGRSGSASSSAQRSGNQGQAYSGQSDLVQETGVNRPSNVVRHELTLRLDSGGVLEVLKNNLHNNGPVRGLFIDIANGAA